jgi:tetratricopeptide (TPR) repeat protein
MDKHVPHPMRVSVIQKKDVFFLAILIVIVFGVYGRSLNFDLIWDSKNFLGDRLAQFESHSLSSALEQGYFKESYTDKSYYYRPLTLATFFLEHSLWGIKTAYLRCTNILIYVLSLIFLFIFFKRQPGNPYFPEFATALFALYPLNMENIVWIVGRGDLLVLLWGVLTFLSLDLWISNKQRVYWILSCFFFAAGLLSKEAFVFLVPTLMLYELVKRKKIFIPYSATIVVMSAAFFVFKSRVIGIKNLELHFSPDWIINAKAFLASLGYYFKILIFPFFYIRFSPLQNLIQPEYITMGIVAIIAFAYIAFRGKGRAVLLIPLSLTVVFICGHALLIYSSVFQFKVYARYMILPGLGLIWILSVYLAKFKPKIKIPIVVLLIILFIVSTGLNINAYRSNIHFWQRAHASLPENGFILYSLASACADDQDYLSAEVHLNKALSHALDKPTALSLSLLYADIEFRKAEYTNVLLWLDRAAQNLEYLKPKLAIYRKSQIDLLAAQVHLSQGKVEDAIHIFKRNIQTLEGYDAQRSSYMALLSLYIGQEMWSQAHALEARIRKDHPLALDKQTAQVKKIFDASSPKKRIRFFVHYMNYARAIQEIRSISDADLETQFTLAEICYFSGRPDDAQGVINTILSERDTDYQILNAIGHFYLSRLFRVKEAVVFFNKSIAVRKDQPDITRLVRRLQNDFLNQLKEIWQPHP